MQSVLLTSGSWVVQAKFTAFPGLGLVNTCGLVADDTTTVDATSVGTGGPQVSLADVITVEEPTRVAVRCSEFGPQELDLLNLKLTAISVDEVVTF